MLPLYNISKITLSHMPVNMTTQQLQIVVVVATGTILTRYVSLRTGN